MTRQEAQAGAARNRQQPECRRTPDETILPGRPLASIKQTQPLIPIRSLRARPRPGRAVESCFPGGSREGGYSGGAKGAKGMTWLEWLGAAAAAFGVITGLIMGGAFLRSLPRRRQERAARKSDRLMQEAMVKGRADMREADWSNSN